jgi:uncharacterized protein (TIGR02300 family)
MAGFQPILFRGFPTVAKPELGTKRLCAGCGAKFYDLGKTPIVCPKCGTTYEIPVVTTRGRPDAAAAARANVAREVPAEAPEPQEAEFVSLEEADVEAQGGGKKAPAGEAAEPDEEEVEIADGDDDTAFIQEEEEEDTDVTEIIGGDIEDKDET